MNRTRKRLLFVLIASIAICFSLYCIFIRGTVYWQSERIVLKGGAAEPPSHPHIFRNPVGNELIVTVSQGGGSKETYLIACKSKTVSVLADPAYRLLLNNLFVDPSYQDQATTLFDIEAQPYLRLSRDQRSRRLVKVSFTTLDCGRIDLSIDDPTLQV